jgi:hypothetical protein
VRADRMTEKPNSNASTPLLAPDARLREYIV